MEPILSPDEVSEATAPSHTVFVDGKELQRALRLALKVVDLKAPMPILSNVRLSDAEEAGFLLIEATNLKATVRIPIQAAGSLGKPLVVPAKALRDAIRGVKKRESVKLVRNEMNLTTSTGATLRGAFTSDWPLPPVYAEDLVTFDAQEFASAFKYVAPAMCKEDYRPNLSAMLLDAQFDRMQLVTTDGHRLHIAKLDGTGALPEGGLLLSREAVPVLLASLGAHGRVAVGKTDNGFGVRLADGITVFSKTVDAKFPPYLQVIPAPGEGNWRFLVDAEQLLELAAAAKQVAPQSGRGVWARSNIAPLALQVSAENPDVGNYSGEVEIVEQYRNEPFFERHNREKGPFLIGSNQKYIMDALAGLEGDVTVEVGDTLDPMTFASGSKLSVVMPMR